MIKKNLTGGAGHPAGFTPVGLKKIRFASLVLLSSLLLGCGSSDSGAQDDTGGDTGSETSGGTGGDTSGGTGGDTGGGTGGDTGGGTGGDTGGGATVTFQSIQQNVFTPNCVGCHGGTNPSAGLNLSAGNAYASLVGVGSSAKDGAVFVINSDPDNSYLVQKLEGAAGIVGQRMPAVQALPAATIQSVRDWIAGGALDN